jgi:hypothetical protein
LSIDVFATLRSGIVQVGERIVNDLRAIPDDKIAVSPGGKARPPADFIYEVAFVNRRFAARLKGTEPPEAPVDGWIIAPEGFQNKVALIAEMEASVKDLLSGFDSHGPDGLADAVHTVQGPWTVLDTAIFVTRHMNYHDAQLNYVQALYGDLEVHW